jgi:lysophospholipase L1-like esterase
LRPINSERRIVYCAVPPFVSNDILTAEIPLKIPEFDDFRKDVMTHDNPKDISFPVATFGSDRRGFLAGLGAAYAGILASADSPVAAQTQPGGAKTTGKKKGPDPASGIAGIKSLLARKDPVAWLFTGDDITQGAEHTKGFRSYPEHFAERVRWELKRMRDLVINSGVSGEKADGLLADLDWRVLHLKPDVVSIMLGTNDCTLGPVGHTLFRKNLTALVNKVMGGGAIPILNTPSTVYLKNVEWGEHLAAYAQIVRDVALGTKAVLVDHYACWETTKPDQEALLEWLDDKKSHPNVFGHRAIANQIFTTIEIFDEASPTCKLEVP